MAGKDGIGKDTRVRVRRGMDRQVWMGEEMTGAVGKGEDCRGLAG
jgi:hypothetical protein